MKRIGFLLKVKAELMDEYKKHHENVWPEMQDALRLSGWHNYTLFIRDDGLIFGYFENPNDFQTALDKIAMQEVNARWNAFMAPYFENLGGRLVDQSMVELEEYFHLD